MTSRSAPFLSKVILIWIALVVPPQDCPGGARVALPPQFPTVLPLAPAGQSFDLRSPEGWARLLRATRGLIEQADAQADAWKQQRAALRRQNELQEMSLADLRRYFWEPDGIIGKKERRALAAIQQLAEQAMASEDRETSRKLREPLFELALALKNNRRNPAPDLEFFLLPFVWWDYHHNVIARGDKLAWNLERAPHPKKDLSRIEPGRSTFWTRPVEIGSQDLYYGFGRADLPHLENHLCVYANPKTSYGGNPGFEVTCGGKRFKVKFAETTSEPFAARIFWALGYQVEAADHAPHLKIRYDRRLLREFHLRKEIRPQIRLLGIVPLHTINLQRRFDPFIFISAAVMKDGTRFSGAQLRSILFHDPQREHPEDWPDNFRREVERQIDYLDMVAANIQDEESEAKSVGPWDFGQLARAGRRELRGLGLLAAWIGWFDSRFENTRLKIIHRGAQLELRHYLTDTGGGLGDAVGPTSRRCEEPNRFDWTFTRPPRVQGKGRMTIPFRIVGFEPIEDTPPYAEMTVDDARWMARMIAQLTEAQLVQALVAAGFDSAQAKLFLEKLVSRRDRMIRDLGLANEIPPLRPRGINRILSYFPERDGPVVSVTGDGKQVAAKDAGLMIANGLVVPAE